MTATTSKGGARKGAPAAHGTGQVVYVGRLAARDGKPAGWVYLVRYPDRSLSGRRIIRGPSPLAIQPRIGETRG